MQSDSLTPNLTFTHPQINHIWANLCKKGTFLDERKQVSSAACKSCTEGTYGNDTGLEKCLNCPVGKHLLKVASTQQSDCRDCRIATYNPFTGHGNDCFPCSTARESGSFTTAPIN